MNTAEKQFTDSIEADAARIIAHVNDLLYRLNSVRMSGSREAMGEAGEITELISKQIQESLKRR